jgi:hypothetical protein
MYSKENNITIIWVMLSQILKPRNYITFTDLEIGLKLALVPKQVSKTRYKSKRKRKTLYHHLYLKARSKQYLT